jgi:hypothetical protein
MTKKQPEPTFKDWLLENSYLKWLLIGCLVSFVIGFWVCYVALEPDVDIEAIVEMERLKEVNTRLDSEIKELYLQIDTTDQYIQRKSLDWQYERQQSDERNYYQIPAEASRINSSDVATQLEYVKSLRDSANARR